jgi:hypothetical protein
VDGAASNAGAASASPSSLHPRSALRGARERDDALAPTGASFSPLAATRPASLPRRRASLDRDELAPWAEWQPYGLQAEFYRMLRSKIGSWERLMQPWTGADEREWGMEPTGLIPQQEDMTLEDLDNEHVAERKMVRLRAGGSGGGVKAGLSKLKVCSPSRALVGIKPPPKSCRRPLPLGCLL